jgi:hypothetical protein
MTGLTTHEINRIKDEVRKRTALAESATDELKKNISNCDVGDMMRNLSKIYIAEGAARILSNIFPDDKNMEELFRKTSKMGISGDVARNKFSMECSCKRKKKQIY